MAKLNYFLEKCSDEKLRNFVKFWKLRSRGECGICRSLQELSTTYLVAKIGVDTAENKLNIDNNAFCSSFLAEKCAFNKTSDSFQKQIVQNSDFLLESAFVPRKRIYFSSFRLYRRRFLRPNTLWKALDKVYKFHIHLMILIFKAMFYFSQIFNCSVKILKRI